MLVNFTDFSPQIKENKNTKVEGIEKRIELRTYPSIV